MRLTDPTRAVLQNPRRAISPAYACAETLWYFSGTDVVAPLTKYAPQYSLFAERDGRAHGAYGTRMGLGNTGTESALHAVRDILHNSPNSRQAVVTIWRDQDTQLAVVENTKQDLPCTVSMQFLLRDSKLHMHVSMRSNDAWLGLPYDIFAFTMVQRVLAADLCVRLGSYNHAVGSMHLYAKHFDAAKEAVDSRAKTRSTGWATEFTTIESMRLASRYWLAMTDGVEFPTHQHNLCHIGRNLVTCCYDFLHPNLPQSCDSLTLQAVHKQWLNRKGAKE